jgi:replicative DNA helicase
MLDTGACTMLSSLLSRHDFYSTSHGLIWAVIRRLNEMGKRPDLVTVQAWLSRLKQLDAVGGPVYLREVMDEVPSSANCEYYAEIVREKAMLRKLVAASSQALEQVYDSALTADEIVFNALTAVSEVAEHKTEDVVELKDVLHKIADDYATQTFIKPLPTGLSELDYQLGGGLRKGEVTVFAGRPGMGKSSLVGDIIRRMAADGHKALVVSLEMSGRSLAVRWLAGVLNVPTQVVQLGHGIDEALVIAAAGELAQLDLSICGASRVMDIKAALMGAEIVVVDYLQLMDIPRGKDSMSDRIGEISCQLKRLAHREDIIILLVSQLNRKVEDRTDKRPMLADLRSSGNIEQDADNVCLLYRPRYYNKQTPIDAEGYEPVFLRIAKQRNGATESVDTLKANLKTQNWKTDEVL